MRVGTCPCALIVLLLSTGARVRAAEVTPDPSRLPWPPPSVKVIRVDVRDGWQELADLLASAEDEDSGLDPDRAFVCLQPAYGGRSAPYVPPYRLRLGTAAPGAWLALPDYGAGQWRIAAGPLSAEAGQALEIPVGLSPDAVDSAGRFCFAVLGQERRPELAQLAVEYPPPPPPGQPLEVRQYLRMRDGTALATSVYLPFEAATPLLPGPPYPAILMRTPYRAEYIDPAYLTLATQLNCAVVTQYFRGRPSPDPHYDPPQPPFVPDSGGERWPVSGGQAALYTDHAGPEHFDALDTVDWLEARSWYNGKLLLTGPSGLGLWIYQAAPALGQRVSAIYPQVAAGDIGDWAALDNGCVRRNNISAWLDTFNYPPDLRAQALAECGKDSCWEPLSSDSLAGRVKCPGFHETCWWDVGVEAGIASWQALNRAGGPGAGGRQWLLIGPWEHGRVRTNRCGALTLPSEPPECDASRPPLRWEGALWAAQLIGRNPLYRAPENQVLAYFIGEQGRTDYPHNHWIELPDWPPASQPRSYYLRDSGLLAEGAARQSRRLRFDLDPADPVPSLGGANIPVGGTPCGPLDQTAAESHAGVLLFRSAPLTKDLCIAGDIRIELSVATEAGDGDVIVKLSDLYDASGGDKLAGASLLVSEGAARISNLGPGAYKPGSTVKLSFSLGQRAYVFGRGHRLGISVQASSYPRFELNPAQENYARAHGGKVSNTLVLEAGNPCRLILPLWPGAKQ